MTRNDDSLSSQELMEIADYIRALHREISALQTNDLLKKRIPAAGQELSAIVKATEQASNTIMECAEAAMAASASASDLAAYKAFVVERMIAVFEACAFQDLTGQRLAKVVDTLKHIELRISRFADATRAQDTVGAVNEKEAAEAARRLRLLIHGPQHDGAKGPADADAKGATQSDIDRLFA
jgi:chemotaxis protein CheZ